jgi:hypothetical protein
MNRQKIKEKEKPAAGPSKTLGVKSARKFVKFLNVFGIFNKEMLLKVMPYIFFLTVIALVYIANSYYAEKTIREIDKINKELKTLRPESIIAGSEYMMLSKQSEVARFVAPAGLKESVEAPKKIVVVTKVNKTAD